MAIEFDPRSAAHDAMLSRMAVGQRLGELDLEARRAINPSDTQLQRIEDEARMLRMQSEFNVRLTHEVERHSLARVEMARMEREQIEREMEMRREHEERDRIEREDRRAQEDRERRGDVEAREREDREREAREREQRERDERRLEDAKAREGAREHEARLNSVESAHAEELQQKVAKFHQEAQDKVVEREQALLRERAQLESRMETTQEYRTSSRAMADQGERLQEHFKSVYRNADDAMMRYRAMATGVDPTAREALANTRANADNAYAKILDRYKDRNLAHARIQDSVERHGLGETMRKLGKNPDEFGKLKGLVQTKDFADPVRASALADVTRNGPSALRAYHNAHQPMSDPELARLYLRHQPQQFGELQGVEIVGFKTGARAQALTNAEYASYTTARDYTYAAERFERADRQLERTQGDRAEKIVTQENVERTADVANRVREHQELRQEIQKGVTPERAQEIAARQAALGDRFKAEAELRARYAAMDPQERHALAQQHPEAAVVAKDRHDAAERAAERGDRKEISRDADGGMQR